MGARHAVIESLTSLSADQRAEVIKWCDALGSSPLSVNENPNSDFAYTELARCFSHYYRCDYPSKLIGFARSKPQAYKKLIRSANHAMGCVHAWWPEERQIVQVALLKYLCRLAFDVSTRRSTRVTWERVIAALGDIEATVNDAFPGWLKAGLFQQRTLTQIKGHQPNVPPRSPMQEHRR